MKKYRRCKFIIPYVTKSFIGGRGAKRRGLRNRFYANHDFTGICKYYLTNFAGIAANLDAELPEWILLV